MKWFISVLKLFILQYFTDAVGPYLIIDESPMIGDNFTNEYKLDWTIGTFYEQKFSENKKQNPYTTD